MKKFFTCLFALFPFKVAHLFLKILGHKVDWNSKIGFSFLWIDKLVLRNNSKIGHFNFIKINEIILEENSKIKALNFLKGPFTVLLKRDAVIGKQNRIQRSNHPISYGFSSLILGKGTRITSNNYLDMTKSISFGENSQVAGIGTQFWTHGYLHSDEGVDRIRIDGEINIGNNVYIGSRCLFNPGVNISNAINIGSNSVISKDLIESGMYVNQRLRFIEKSFEATKQQLKKVEDVTIIEQVYTKK